MFKISLNINSIFKYLTNKLIIPCLILPTVVEVRFDRNSATFSENGGNQSIYVVLQGGVLLQDLTITIYDVDTSENS